MIVEKIDPERECFGDYSLEGTMLTVGGIAVDLAAEESDQQVIVTFGYCEGQVHRGLAGRCCEYAAEAIIPPRRYRIVEVEGGSGMFPGGDEKDGVPATHTESVPAPWISVP
jgi:hypothetical protein